MTNKPAIVKTNIKHKKTKLTNRPCVICIVSSLLDKFTKILMQILETLA